MIDRMIDQLKAGKDASLEPTANPAEQEDVDNLLEAIDRKNVEISQARTELNDAIQRADIEHQLRVQAELTIAGLNSRIEGLVTAKEPNFTKSDVPGTIIGTITQSRVTDLYHSTVDGVWRIGSWRTKEGIWLPNTGTTGTAGSLG